MTRSTRKAVASLRRDQAQLLTFFDFPAEHWRHLRTTNIIESPFATVRLRQRAGSRTKALMMAFKLLEMAEDRRRRRTPPNSRGRTTTFDNFSGEVRSPT
jgi:transposase-like protein